MHPRTRAHGACVTRTNDDVIHARPSKLLSALFMLQTPAPSPHVRAPPPTSPRPYLEGCRYLILDFGLVTGLDATGARTVAGVCRELLRAGIQPIASGLRGSSRGGMGMGGGGGVLQRAQRGPRDLLLAHGLPLWPMHWPSEAEEGGASAWAWQRAEGALAGDQQQQLLGAYQGSPPAPPPMHCLEFEALQEAARYCEDRLLELAVACGLCNPMWAQLSLAQLLQPHMEKVGG
jgi:hypothetical protein